MSVEIVYVVTGLYPPNFVKKRWQKNKKKSDILIHLFPAPKVAFYSIVYLHAWLGFCSCFGQHKH